MLPVFSMLQHVPLRFAAPSLLRTAESTSAVQSLHSAAAQRTAVPNYTAAQQCIAVQQRALHSAHCARQQQAATEIVPTEPSAYTATQQNTAFISTATRNQSVAHHRNIRIKHRKLNDICRMIRGLSVAEAKIQLKLSNKQYHADTICKVIANAATCGQVNFNMNPDRMYVAEAIVGKAPCYIIPDIKARGRAGRIEVGFSHLTIVVKEQLPDMSAMMYKKVKNAAFRADGTEKRIGRFGPTLQTQQKQRDAAERVKQRQEAVEQAREELKQRQSES